MKVLVVSEVSPEPAQCGQSVIVRNVLRLLVHELNANVSLVVESAMAASQASRLRSWCVYECVELLSAVTVDKTGRSRELVWRARLALGAPSDQREWLECVADYSRRVDVVFVHSTAHNPITSELPALCAAPVVLFAADSITRHIESLSRSAKNRILRVLDAGLERRVANDGYAALVYVSEADAKRVKRMLPRDAGMRVRCIPNGVDSVEFSPCQKPRSGGGELTLLFTGALDYQPNIGAVITLCHEIMPMLGRRSDHVRLLIAGRNPVDHVLRSAAALPFATVISNPDRMRDIYRLADLFVAPLASGTGIKNKVLEAMACGLPVLGSRQCFEAFGEIPPGCVQCDESEQYVAAIALYLNARDAVSVNGRAARGFVEEKYSWHARVPAIRELLCAAKASV